jgi:hypothetical protein
LTQEAISTIVFGRRSLEAKWATKSLRPALLNSPISFSPRIGTIHFEQYEVNTDIVAGFAGRLFRIAKLRSQASDWVAKVLDAVIVTSVMT